MHPPPRSPQAGLAPAPRPTTRRRRAPRALAALLALALALPAPAQVRLPALGESASQDLSIADERRLGDAIMAEGRRDPSYYDEPVLLEYLQQLWLPLVAAARQRGDIDADTERSFAWEAFLLRERSVNAFALPGGYIGVHLGLLAATSTRDQFASVLAHELTHVSQRHIARSIAPQARSSMLALAGMLIGLIAASRSNNADVANAAILGGQGAAVQGQLNFSRDMEREADRVGYGLLAQAGYSPAGMAAMFERLDAANRHSDNSAYPYLRSHPLTADRITEARNRTLLAGDVPPPPTPLHALMQARARVLMDDGATALQRFNGSSASPLPLDRAAALYAGALAASRLREHAHADTMAAQADDLLRTLQPRDAGAERALRLLRAELALARGDGAAALATLGSLAGRPVLLLRAQSALALQRAGGDAAEPLRTSAGDLQTWIADQPRDAAAWLQLAAVSDTLGQRLRALRAGAEAQLWLGDLPGAIDRLRAAQSAARGASGPDFIEASVIDARLRQLMQQRREQVLEARGGRGGPPPDDDTARR